MPENVEDRWVDYFTGQETSPNCSTSAVALPFPISYALLEPSNECPPGTTPEEAARMLPTG